MKKLLNQRIEKMWMWMKILLIYTDDEEEDDGSEDEDSGEEIEMDRSIREVRVPQLKWQARSYHTMINWKKDLETEPPFTCKLTDERLVLILDCPLEVPSL